METGAEVPVICINVSSILSGVCVEVTRGIILAVVIGVKLSLEARRVVGVAPVIPTLSENFRDDPAAHISKVDATRRRQRRRSVPRHTAFYCLTVLATTIPQKAPYEAITTRNERCHGRNRVGPRGGNQTA